METKRASDQSGTFAERARRTWRLRRHVIAISLACFVLFFGVMAIRLSLGDDPALGNATGSSSTAAGGSGPPEGSEGPSVEGQSLFGEGDQQIEPEAMSSGQS